MQVIVMCSPISNIYKSVQLNSTTNSICIVTIKLNRHLSKTKKLTGLCFGLHYLGKSPL